MRCRSDSMGNHGTHDLLLYLQLYNKPVAVQGNMGIPFVGG